MYFTISGNKIPSKIYLILGNTTILFLKSVNQVQNAGDEDDDYWVMHVCLFSWT